MEGECAGGELNGSVGWALLREVQAGSSNVDLKSVQLPIVFP